MIYYTISMHTQGWYDTMRGSVTKINESLKSNNKKGQVAAPNTAQTFGARRDLTNYILGYAMRPERFQGKVVFRVLHRPTDRMTFQLRGNCNERCFIGLKN